MQPQQQQQPQHNPGLTFLGMSGGILALVMAMVILLPILGVVGCCVAGVLGAAVDPAPTASTYP